MILIIINKGGEVQEVCMADSEKGECLWFVSLSLLSFFFLAFLFYLNFSSIFIIIVLII